mgnify:FL=1|jgi:hypothetical protein
MQVNVVDVSNLNTHTAKNGRQYQSVEVMYKNDQGQAQNKKLMSFANPAVFKAAQEWQKGDVVHVSTEKDTNGYWQWTAVGGADDTTDTGGSSAPAAQGNAAKPATRVSGSNYETKEERAARQVMIVRQSSLSNAVATLGIEGSKATANDVISLAKLYESFVLGFVSNTPDITDEPSDIPF